MVTWLTLSSTLFRATDNAVGLALPARSLPGKCFPGLKVGLGLDGDHVDALPDPLLWMSLSPSVALSQTQYGIEHGSISTW